MFVETSICESSMSKFTTLMYFHETVSISADMSVRLYCQIMEFCQFLWQCLTLSLPQQFSFLAGRLRDSVMVWGFSALATNSTKKLASCALSQTDTHESKC